MFNPEARWDRSLPGNKTSHLNEPIRVVAVFEHGRVTPRWFFWHKKIYKIKKVNYCWQERQGRELLSQFSVETPGGLYQISFSNQSLGWRLSKIL